MTIAKPVREMYMYFGRDDQAGVYLNPRQKWQSRLYESTAILWRDCLTIAIPVNDFKRCFKWYEEGGNSNE